MNFDWRVIYCMDFVPLIYPKVSETNLQLPLHYMLSTEPPYKVFIRGAAGVISSTLASSSAGIIASTLISSLAGCLYAPWCAKLLKQSNWSANNSSENYVTQFVYNDLRSNYPMNNSSVIQYRPFTPVF